MDIERLATSAVVNSISKTDVLSSFINDGDKEPSWDGNIYIYSNKSKSKDDIKKVPVQIKGMTRKLVPPKKPPKFSTSVIDLENWKNDGGVMLFVVLLDEAGEKSAIYYSSLLPVKINILIQASKGKLSISVPLRVFPDNSDEKVSVLLNFYENMKKQTSFAKASLISSDKLMSDGVLENISFTVTAYGEKQKQDWQSILFQDDVYMYANIKGSAIPQPLPELPMALHIGTIIDGDICVGDTIYYHSYAVVRNCEGATINIGKSIKVELKTEGKKLTVKYKLAGTLDDYCIDTECFIAMMEQKQISINSHLFSLAGLPNADIESYKNRLFYFRDVKTMLNKLGVMEALDCSAISKADENTIRDLTNAVVYDKSLGFSGRDENLIFGRVNIANLSIWIWATKNEDSHYQLENFFIPHRIAVFENTDIENTNPVPASHYLLLDKDAFTHTSNIDYEKIKQDICAMEHFPMLLGCTIYLLLNILRGYDAQVQKDTALLDLADSVCDWLAAYKEEIDSKIVRLNQLQIVKRKRDLTIPEIVELGKITVEENDSHVRCGAYLLLGDIKNAQQCFDDLPPETQKEFITYPICHFGALKINGEE